VINVENLGNYKIKFVYFVDDTEVGYVIVEDALDIINIVDVFVEKEYRRNGYAFSLLSYVFNYFKNRDVKFMLEVREDNYSAIKLYEKCGLSKIHVRKKYYKDVDAIIMEVKK
jgi:ribosomal-protein-alanine N-acetyltransferase